MIFMFFMGLVSGAFLMFCLCAVFYFIVMVNMDLATEAEDSVREYTDQW